MIEYRVSYKSETKAIRDQSNQRPTVPVQTNQPLNSIHDMISSERAHSVQQPWQPFIAIVDQLQRHEQLGATGLLLSGYRPLAFVLQQSLYFLMPLALLLGFSLAQITTGTEVDLADATRTAEDAP